MPRKGSKRKRKLLPGCQVLPEDALRNHSLEREPVPKRQPREVAERVAETPSAAIDIRTVERRVYRAMKTLRALPDREKRFLEFGSMWPPYVQASIDAYASVDAPAPRFCPTPFDVSDFLTALSWARHLSKDEWNILWWRSFDFSFGLIAKYIGRSDETARRKYRDVMIDVWCTANNLQARGAGRLVGVSR